MTIEKTEVSRRTLVKGAAWSLPVIAVAAATPLAAASAATSDLVPVLSGPVTLNLSLGPVTLASINVVNTLTITNNGTVASPAGATATVTYNSALLTLNISGVGVDVLPGDGSDTLTLPAIAPGESLVINLGTTLDSLLDLSLLQSLLGGDPELLEVALAGDGVTSNNNTSSEIGISIL
ncbi:hypothetical protein [Microbacterium sp.]|uniref:hypothetical protein n=1 Tax=Microbacterium sp. TaxID=51671 RepID=UPI002811CC1D|nr:hypothetical protein [Microbacterium sp.]